MNEAPLLSGQLLILRADASVSNGMGHIGRCLAMAEAWQDSGGRALLAASGPKEALTAMAAGVGMHWLGPECPAAEADAKQFIQLCRQTSSSLAWLDSYNHDVRFETQVRDAIPLVAVDDLASRPHDSDVVVDTSLGMPDAARYSNVAAPRTLLLLGTPYVALRRAFRTGGFTPRGGAPVRSILLSFGGTDPKGHTAAAIEAIRALRQPDIGVDVVLSRANPRLDELASTVAANGMALHVDTREMANLMARADLAVGAGGSTSWERCRAGLPTLMTIIADNQLGVAKVLERAGIIRLVPSHDPLQLADNFYLALRDAMADGRWRTAASNAGMAMIDGNGGRRLVRALQELLSKPKAQR